MSMNELDGIRVNGKTISAAVGLFTLFAMLVGGVSFVIRQDFRISHIQEKVAHLELQVEKSEAATAKNYEQILKKFDDLTAEVTKLTIALGNLQYKQDIQPRPARP